MSPKELAARLSAAIADTRIDHIYPRLSKAEVRTILSALDAQGAEGGELDMAHAIQKERDALLELQAEWGADYDLKIAVAARAARFFGGQALIDWLNKTGNGNAPVLIRAFAKAGDMMEKEAAAAARIAALEGELAEKEKALALAGKTIMDLDRTNAALSARLTESEP